MSINFADAIISLSPNAQFIIRGNDIDCLEWLDDIHPKPSKEEIETELLRLQAEYEATEYQRLREAAYPKIGDQLDALYHYFEASNITNDFTDMIKVVKDQFPKPTV